MKTCEYCLQSIKYGHDEMCPQGEIERLRAENEGLRTALGAYGQHAPDCLYGTVSLNEGPRKCDCGLHAALRGGEAVDRS